MSITMVQVIAAETCVLQLACAVPAFGTLDELQELRQASLLEYQLAERKTLLQKGCARNVFARSIGAALWSGAVD